MQKVIVNNETYSVPETWGDVTIRQQLEISKVSERDDQFKSYHLVSTYTGIPMKLLRFMNINQFEQVLSIMKFLGTEIESKLITEFDFKGHTYYLADSILKGQTQDFLSLEAVTKEHKDNEILALPIIIAIVAKRAHETLDMFDVYKRSEEFMDLPYETAAGIWFFFAQTNAVLSIDTKQFLHHQHQATETLLNYSESIVRKSVGVGLFRRLLKTILLLYIKFIRKNWQSFLTTTRSKSSKENFSQKFKKKFSKNQKEKLVLDAKE